MGIYHIFEKHKEQDKKTLLSIGTMSGTSADGVDASIIISNGEKIYHFGDIYSHNYTAEQSTLIKSAYGIDKRTASKPELELLEKVANTITTEHIIAIKKLLEKSGLTANQIDIISFHGQTIIHKPEEAYTLQIGNPQKIANELKINVVADLRQNDIKNGGQGAPLIPIHHKTLCYNLEKPTAIINIGGVANITYIENDNLIGFDTGTGNAMINDWVKKHYNIEYDKDGEIARSGTINKDILSQLLSHPYFKQPAPKSLDRNDFINHITPLIKNLSPQDGTATLTEFTTKSIALSIKQCPNTPKQILIVGGGAYNKYMVERINKLTNINTVIKHNDGFNPTRVEADGFALLAIRHIHNLPITFNTTTGVKKRGSMGGKIYRYA